MDRRKPPSSPRQPLSSANNPVTIGRAISQTQIHLMNGDGHAAPPGKPGEIYISGAGVARGYLNRPDLQNEKFIVTDILTGKPMRFYRTGDLGRFTEEGELIFLGRIDDQVKVRGFRIELSEIEAALALHSGILAAAVAVDPQTQRLAAYIVSRAGQIIDRTALRHALHEKLPAYMVPATLDELTALPMTASGKIDRKKLPEPLLPRFSSSVKRRLARSAPYGRRTRHFWRSLGIRAAKQNDVSIKDDFFLDLDGHSLLAGCRGSRIYGGAPGFL